MSLGNLGSSRSDSQVDGNNKANSENKGVPEVDGGIYNPLKKLSFYLSICATYFLVKLLINGKLWELGIAGFLIFAAFLNFLIDLYTVGKIFLRRQQ